MIKRIIRGVTIECVQGDIVEQRDMEAIVNAANAELRPGGGVAGAIHAAAGPDLERECRAFAPIRPGQAVITGAHNLPNRFVIHCLGPVHGRDEPAHQLLAACYRNALRLATQDGVRSLAFPAISTGAFGYPMQAAANVAIRSVVESISENGSLETVRFVLFDEFALRAYTSALEQWR